MIKTVIVTASLLGLLAVTACANTGIAPPSGSYVNQPGIQLGAPGSGAP